MVRPTITPQDVHAYVDGQLAPERMAEVEVYLLAHPDEAQRVAQLREMNQLLRGQHAQVLAEQVPARLQKMRISRPWLGSVLVAASVSWFAVGGVMGWIARETLSPTQTFVHNFPQQAAVAHAVYVPEVVHPVEVTAEQETHLVTWLSKRLNTKMTVPHLTDYGYHLVGGRLLPGATSPAAQYMYQNDTGQRLTLYVKTGEINNGATAFQYTHEHGVSVFYWIDGSLGYALTGNLEKNMLLTLSTAVYQQLAHE